MIVTHSGRFHADEIFAIVMIQMIESHDVVRSRDPEIIVQGDIVLDVGGEYDHATRRYDHHQNSFTDKRETGIPYATAGLVWKHYGETILQKYGLSEQEDIQFALKWVDQKIVSDVDALDNGLFLESPRPSVSMLVGMRNADSSEDDDVQRACFEDAIVFTEGIFERFVKTGVKQAFAQKEFAKYAVDLGNGIVELEKQVSFKEIIKSKPEITRVVYPKGEEGYGVFCNGQANHLPEHVRGLREHDLQAVSKLEDAVFCHKTGFMAVLKSRESALAMARL